MNVLLLTTYPHGGAGGACNRLQGALIESGHDAAMLTADQLGFKWPFYAERLSFLPYERDKSVRFSFSLANFGHNLANHPLVRAADILYLHWINQGLLSLQNIRQLAQTGKPLVWTLHDMWAFTGGCHYSGACKNYETDCGSCPMLRWSHPGDLSHRVWKRKKNILPSDIQFITCSEWLAGIARQSSLLSAYPIVAIPNAIDTSVFKPIKEADRKHFRQALTISDHALVLLFAAMKVSEPRKGFSYLLEALKIFKNNHPSTPVELLVIGKSDPVELAALPYPFHSLGLIRDMSRLVEIYGSADAFVIPSLEDNLPNTVMEALACGTPVIGFVTGGFPEMAGHLQEGFIAPQRDAAALAEGISRLASDPEFLSRLRVAARKKAEIQYSNPVVAARHLDIYRQLIRRHTS